MSARPDGAGGVAATPTPSHTTHATALVRSHDGARAVASGPTLLVEDWFAGLAPTTVITYGGHLRRFAEWLAVPMDVLPTAFLGGGRGHATMLVRRYRAHLRDQGRAPATVNTALAALQSLVTLARAAEHVDWTLEVPYLKVRPLQDTAGPGLPGVRALLRAAGRQAPVFAARDTALVRILFDLALRRSELTTLDWPEHGEHVAAPTGGVQLVALLIRGKGQDERERLTLPAETADALAAWLLARGPTPGPLFVSLAHRHVARGQLTAGRHVRLAGRGVGDVLARLARAAVLDPLAAKRAHPHGLRHTAITAALDAGAPLRDVQRFSRHAKANMLARYDDNRRAPAQQIARAVAALV